MDVRGKVCVITGATSGIGEAAAAELAGRGARVFLAVRNKRKAAATVTRIAQTHPRADLRLAPALLDTSSAASVRAFAAAWRATGRPIHVLIHNAAALTRTAHFTPEGVAELAAVNYLGAYHLTRLLEDVLAASRCRVVVVSSITHRMGALGPDVKRDFLCGEFGHVYANTKLANCLFAYELQRRLGRHGLQTCIVDPGGIRTGIWRNEPWALRRLVGLVCAPPSEGARPLVHAATLDWEDPEELPPASTPGGRRRPRAAPPPPREDLRYYAPRAFALPLLTWYQAEGNRGWLGRLMMRLFNLPVTTPWGLARQGAWAAAAVAVAVFYWPLRQLPGGRWAGRVVAAPSAAATFDPALGRALWEASAELSGVPREVQFRAA